MSVILCRWLNQDLRLSQAADSRTFARDFSSGYLIGEILHKHQIQDDFNMFMKMDTSISKVNNFKRLEPTLELLGIYLDKNTTKDLMEEKPGAAMHLLYQLYVSLEKKNDSNFIKTKMQPAARINLLTEDRELPQVVNCDVCLKLKKTCQHYGDKFQQLNANSVVADASQQMAQLKVYNEKQMEKSGKVFHKKPNDISRNLTTKAQVIKPPSRTPLKMETRKQQQKEQQAQKVKAEIAKFETNRKKTSISGFVSSSNCQPLLVDPPHDDSKQGCKISGNGIQPILQFNSKYIQEIRQRLRENTVACEQREKRKHRFLMEQFKAHKAQQEAHQEEQLIKRLTNEAMWERHTVAQLMQVRRQKDEILANRLVRHHQFREQREKDFQRALYGDTVKQDE